MCTALHADFDSYASETWSLAFWACRAITGPWSMTYLQYQTKKHDWCKIKRTTGVTSAQGPWPHLERRLCWYGHVEHSSNAVKTACNMQQVVGTPGPKRPKMTMKKLAENDWPLKVEALSPQPPWKEHQVIRCEICFTCWSWASQLPIVPNEG